MREKIIAILMTFVLAACGSSGGGGGDDPVGVNGCGETVSKSITIGTDTDLTLVSKDEKATLLVAPNTPQGSRFTFAITVECGIPSPSLNGKGYFVDFSGNVVPQYNLVITYELPSGVLDSDLGIGIRDSTQANGWLALPPLQVDGPSNGTVTGLGLDDDEEIFGIFVAQSGGGGDTTPPFPPTNVVLQTTGGVGTITVNWDESQDNPGGSGIKGYDVLRSTDGFSFIQISPAPPAPPVTGDHYVDSPPGVGSTRYCYAVRAVDNAGNRSGQSVFACYP